MSQEEQDHSYYTTLNLPPWASAQQIRQSYREMSKRYHPDTTELPPAIATTKFQQINEAYATLSNPERRMAYDLKIGYSRIAVIQKPDHLDRSVSRSRHSYSRSAYLEPTDRPLSPGEVFAVFILGLTFAACLLLVIAIGLARGESAFQPLAQVRDLSRSSLIYKRLEPSFLYTPESSTSHEFPSSEEEGFLHETLPPTIVLPTSSSESQVPAAISPTNTATDMSSSAS